MKKSLLIGLLMAGVATAGFETWTNKDGKAAELELVRVVEKDGEKAGEFKMRNGTVVTLAASDLSEESAERLAQWQPPAEPVVSVFDEVLDGNLVKLDGNSLKRHTLENKPQKYYAFYYTASWCGPCVRFTPSLVDFYNKHKNDDFELVLISSDRDEGAMQEYAKKANMPWPQLRLRRVADFRKKFPHPGTGIPNLVLCDVNGDIIMTSYVERDGKLTYQGPTAVMNHLAELLKK